MPAVICRMPMPTTMHVIAVSPSGRGDVIMNDRPRRVTGRTLSRKSAQSSGQKKKKKKINKPSPSRLTDEPFRPVRHFMIPAARASKRPVGTCAGLRLRDYSAMYLSPCLGLTSPSGHAARLTRARHCSTHGTLLPRTQPTAPD
jgi:hypothetical protein